MIMRPRIFDVVLALTLAVVTAQLACSIELVPAAAAQAADPGLAVTQTLQGEVPPDVVPSSPVGVTDPVAAPHPAAPAAEASVVPMSAVTWGTLIAGLAGLLAALLASWLSRKTATPFIAQLLSGIIIGLAAVSTSTAVIGLTDWKAALFSAIGVLGATIGGIMIPTAQITMTARPGVTFPSPGVPGLTTRGCAQPGMIAMLVVLGLALFAATSCAMITPAVKAGGDVVTNGYTTYVGADLTLSGAQKAERQEVACNHRRLLGLTVPAWCPPAGGAP
jgi:hypothetical protein